MVGPQPTGPTSGLADAVRTHAPGLHRTAVMLAGDSSGADLLVAEAYRRAGQRVWGRDLLLHELVRAFLRHARALHQDELHPTAGWDQADPGDILASLRPKERAATVLVRAEGWPLDRSARALQVRPGTVPSLVAREHGVVTALEAAADQHACPAHEVVAAVLAALPVRERQTRTRVGRRPGTWRWLAAAVALGLVVWVSALGDTARHERTGTTADARTGLATTTGDDLAGRGWDLDLEGGPPVDLEGLRLVESLHIDLARADHPLRLDTQPRSGAALFAVLWCDLPAVDANLQLPAARLQIGRDAVTLPCAGTDGDPPVERLVPLPSAEGRGRTTALVSWTGDVPGRGEAMLATYTEVGAGPRPRDEAGTAPPVVREGTVVLDGTSPAYQVRDRPVHHLRVRVGPGSTITAWAGAVGEMTVQVDHVVVTDDGEREADAWRTADPELREGRWLVYRPSRTRTFALPGAVRPGEGETREVTVAVTTTMDRRGWQVQVSGAEVVEQQAGAMPLTDAAAPEWIGGHRLVAAWKVPNDGIPHPLVDPGLRPGRRFLLVGAPPGTEVGPWGVVEPHVATTRGAAGVTIVREVADAFDDAVWRHGDQLVLAGASTANILRGTGTGVLAATVPAATGETAPSTLLAYQPVAYEDFDFAAAPPAGASVALGELAASRSVGSSVPDTVVVGRWTRQDLDQDGRLTVDTELTGRTWLRLTTEGRGRVQVLEGGRPALWLPDGWWTSWTAEPVVTELRVVGTRGHSAPGRPFELRVEGYEKGFAVEVLVRDGAPDHRGPPETLGR